MKFFDEMQDKYGFADGEREPSEARCCRTSYVFFVNQFAKNLGSQWRVVAYDRPGMHNSCMIVFVDLAVPICSDPEVMDGTKSIDGFSDGVKVVRLHETDDRFQEAVDLATDMNPDEFVITTVSFDWELAVDSIEEALQEKSNES